MILGTFKILKIGSKIEPDYIFHLTSLVKFSYFDPVETWHTNNGKCSYFGSIRSINNKCIGIIITSDKCYENNEWYWDIEKLID